MRFIFRAQGAKAIIRRGEVRGRGNRESLKLGSIHRMGVATLGTRVTVAEGGDRPASTMLGKPGHLYRTTLADTLLESL